MITEWISVNEPPEHGSYLVCYDVEYDSDGNVESYSCCVARYCDDSKEWIHKFETIHPLYYAHIYEPPKLKPNNDKHE